MITIITGTDTGIGKTVTTAAFAARSAPRAVVVKPVQTGTRTEVADTTIVQRLSGRPTLELARLEDPLAPDTAARQHGDEVPTISEHAARIRELARIQDAVIVEGSGGLLVRLDTNGGTLADLAIELAQDHPVRIYVVTRVALGTLNHTELTVNALRTRHLEPTGLVFGAVPETPAPAEKRNRTELPRVTGIPVVAEIPAGAGDFDPADFRSRSVAWLAGHFDG